MAILTMIMGFIGNIISEVLTNVLQTPAITTEVETVTGTLDTKATSVDALIDKYKWVRDRSEGEG